MEKKNSINALRKSWELTQGVTLKLLGFYLVQALLVILGLIALVVGLFVAIPVISLAQVYVYKKLSGSK